MGIGVDDESIRDVFERGETKTVQYRFIPNEEPNHYPPNTVRFDLELDNGEQLTIVGHSIGGGKVYISRINEYTVSLRGEYPTLVMFYRDQPGMIWQVTKIIAEEGINIASLICSRKEKGTEAFMAICLDTLLPEPQVSAIRQIPDVFTVCNVDKIPS